MYLSLSRCISLLILNVKLKEVKYGKKAERKGKLFPLLPFFHAFCSYTKLDELNMNIYIQKYLCFL